MKTPKNSTRNALLVGLAASLFMLLLFWLGGYDFDTRGETAVFAAVMSPAVGALGFCASKAIEAEL